MKAKIYLTLSILGLFFSGYAQDDIYDAPEPAPVYVPTQNSARRNTVDDYDFNPNFDYQYSRRMQRMYNESYYMPTSAYINMGSYPQFNSWNNPWAWNHGFGISYSNGWGGNSWQMWNDPWAFNNGWGMGWGNSWNNPWTYNTGWGWNSWGCNAWASPYYGWNSWVNPGWGWNGGGRGRGRDWNNGWNNNGQQGQGWNNGSGQRPSVNRAPARLPRPTSIPGGGRGGNFGGSNNNNNTTWSNPNPPTNTPVPQRTTGGVRVFDPNTNSNTNTNTQPNVQRSSWNNNNNSNNSGSFGGGNNNNNTSTPAPRTGGRSGRF